MLIRKRRVATLCAVLGLALATTVIARVAMRVPSDPVMQLEALGGRQMYASPFMVNGVETQVRTYTFDGAPELLSRTLLARLGMDGGADADGALAKLPARYGNASLLLLPDVNGAGLTALLVTAQQRFDGHRAETSAWIFPGIPIPAGFTPAFNAVNKQTSTLLCTGYSSSPDAAALQIAMDQIEGAGWTVVSPAPTRTSLRMFTRGDRLMVVCAVPREQGCAMLFMQKNAQ